MSGTCDDIRAALAERAGRGGRERPEWERHLADCPDCRQELELALELEDAMKADNVQVPADLAARVMQAVRSERPAAQDRTWWWLVACLAAQALALALSRPDVPGVWAQILGATDHVWRNWLCGAALSVEQGVTQGAGSVYGLAPLVATNLWLGAGALVLAIGAGLLTLHWREKRYA